MIYSFSLKEEGLRKTETSFADAQKVQMIYSFSLMEEGLRKTATSFANAQKVQMIYSFSLKEERLRKTATSFANAQKVIHLSALSPFNFYPLWVLEINPVDKWRSLSRYSSLAY
jgi:hypothetical protein